jgi:YYY domain-containing protein
VSSLIVWYLAVQCIGVVGFALGWRVCAGLPDRGYCAAKTLGVALVGLVLWLGTASGLLRNGAGGALLAYLALFVLALSWRGRPGSVTELLSWIRRHRSILIAAEALYAVAFLAWCWVRAHDPAVDHTEEPMDLMLLVGVSSSDHFPPRDPWLAGYPISYYYFGYWLQALLGHLAGTPPERSYNLAQATWFGLLLLGCFGLVFDLAALSLPRTGEDSRTPLRAGLLGALVVGISANLGLPLEWARRQLDGTAATLWSENWWWWRSSRVVHDVAVDGSPIEVITEFPFFSYLLGDNHPHVLAMPVVLLTLTLALAIFVGPAVGSIDGGPAPRRRGIERWVPGGAPSAALVLAVAGSIAAINTWDVPAAWSILVLATAAAAIAAAPAPEAGGGRRVGLVFWRTALVAGSLVALATALIYLPYHLTASSQVRGVLPNLLHPTALAQVLVMFGTLAPGVALLLVEGWTPASARLGRALRLWLVLLGAAAGWLIATTALAAFGWLWKESAGAASGVAGLALERWSAGWPTLAFATAALALVVEALRARSRAPDGSGRGVTFALLLAAGGLALIAAPELLYLHDSFGTRMNTVFKFYYQAWLLLGLACALGLALAMRGRSGLRLAAMVALLAVGTGLFYPVMALWTKTGGFSSEPTLDSLAWLERYRPDELQAIQWLRSSTAPDAVVVQRSGASYRPEHNLPSMITGRPTLLGWGGHEYQWRGAAFERLSAGREEALASIYMPADRSQLVAALAAWRVDYVYLGPEERSRYQTTPEREGVLAEAMDLVFENGAVRIYRRRG